MVPPKANRTNCSPGPAHLDTRRWLVEIMCAAFQLIVVYIKIASDLEDTCRSAPGTAAVLCR